MANNLAKKEKEGILKGFRTCTTRRQMKGKLGRLSSVPKAKIPEAMPTRAKDARYREAIPRSLPLYFLTYRCNHRALRGHVQPLDELITRVEA